MVCGNCGGFTLVGVPQWECLSEVEDELRVKVTGKTGAIFKIRLPGLDYRFITIDENNSLKEINYIIFENFIYSIARRWHNILNNAGPFEHGSDRQRKLLNDLCGIDQQPLLESLNRVKRITIDY